MSIPINPDMLKLLEEQRRLKTQQQPPAQPPVASNPPPNEATATADAALLAANQVQQNRDANSMRREEESMQATASLDEADRFASNAQVARQMADESDQLANQQREQASQLAQIHQQEEAEEQQQVAQATEVAQQADVARVLQDPETLNKVKPDLAAAIGVNVKDLDAETESTFREVQGIFSGQLDTNNQRQVALAKKIEEGKGFSNKEKIALGMAALLPIIIGAAQGNIGKGFAAAGQAVGALSNAKLSQQPRDLAEQTRLEDRQLKLASGKLGNQSVFLNQKGKISDIDIQQQNFLDNETKKELELKGIKLNNVSRLEKAKQEKILTKDKILKFQETISKIERGEALTEGVIKPTQRQAATFSVRMAQAEDVFGVLEKEGFSPVEGEGFLANRLQGDQRQAYDQAKKNFVNALLRRESGAAISDGEFDSADVQYFPQPGDGASALAQKRANRATVIAGLQAEAGKTAINDIHKLLGGNAPVTKVSSTASTPSSFSVGEMSDEELQKIIEGGN